MSTGPRADGNYYWNFNYETGKWEADPSTNPNGAHAPQGANAPPPEDYNPVTPHTPITDFAQFGLAGGNGTDFWLAQMLTNMQQNPETYGFTPPPGFDWNGLITDFVQEWNSMDQQQREWTIQFDPNNGFQGWENAQRSWDNRPGPPPKDPPPPEDPPQQVVQQPRNAGIQPGDPNAQQAWTAGEGQQAFSEAYRAWVDGGRNGPQPTPEDFGATRNGRQLVWPDQKGTEPGDPPVYQDNQRVADPQKRIIRDVRGNQQSTPQSTPTSPGGSRQSVLSPPGGQQSDNMYNPVAKGGSNPAMSQTAPTGGPKKEPGNSLGGGSSFTGRQSTYGGPPQQKKFQKKYPVGGSLS